MRPSKDKVTIAIPMTYNIVLVAIATNAITATNTIFSKM